ncbi:snRNA-activating protein complex subunit 4 [Tribolium madens]|uniref:snRNA-activating protein complex subunit 4 n=1 Tax=Tribolium madens TaxID=41895 RepID=UPI001CF74CC0|nr:snRNA-activating protein complex subunit 4 [Tribolium madens]
MDDEQDLKNMNDFINNQKSYQDTFQVEFQDFVNFKQEDTSDQEFDEKITPYQIQESPEQPPNLTLSEDEKQVIDSCSDPELKRLLVLNRSKNLQLLKLQKKIQQLLQECEAELGEKNNTLKNSEPKQSSHQTNIWKLAAPYFKDERFFSSPLNGDAIKKRARNELNIYDLVPSPKWTPIEFDRLHNAVKCNYNINRQTAIVAKIRVLKAKVSTGGPEKQTKLKEIVQLREELEKIKDDEEIPPLNSNEHISWYKVSETFLKDKHTPLECQSVWHMLLHPQINKSEWTEEENKKLEKIAKHHSYQNWDLIASELNNNRTGFTTCLHYFSKLCDKFKKNKFTPEEDSFLLEVVDSYKIGNFIPWNKVVCHFDNRSRHQLYHRYTYFLSQNHVKKGKFSEAEDILLTILVNKFGRNFKKCAEYMPHRSQIQLKSRYNSNLQRNIKKGTFTVEDDEIIYNYAQEHGEKNWSGLTDRLKRCNAQIRHRYKLIKSFLHENPDSELRDIPKRKHRFNEVSDDHFSFLNYIAEQYRDLDEIPTLEMIQESLKAEVKTSETKFKNVDTLLIDFFKNTTTTTHKFVSETYLVEATENAQEVLTTLGVNLDIPNDLQCNSNLDTIDLEILERLSKKQSDQSTSSSSKLVPPNLSTLIGLRSLILKHKEYKQKHKKSDKLAWPMEQNCESTRNEVLFHRELFSKRFDTLFDWSAVLSLEKPNLESEPSTSTKSVKRVSQSENTVVKKRKIHVTDLANISKTDKSQLRLVDNSVVERLMKSKKNIIRIETVTDSNGTVRPVFASQKSGNQVLKNVVDHGDVQDVEKLNNMLKTMKSEAIPESGNDEYQAIKGDVQLLKEILQYEKIKTKSDPDG